MELERHLIIYSEVEFEGLLHGHGHGHGHWQSKWEYDSHADMAFLETGVMLRMCLAEHVKCPLGISLR